MLILAVFIILLMLITFFVYRKKGSRALLVRILLLTLSVLMSLSAAETALRILRPGLKNLVESSLQKNRYRIFANPRTSYGTYIHPDTGNPHPLIYNKLGLRQHREINPVKKPDTVRICFLGDSYTANLGMRAEYSFTEPLDYLLNRCYGKYEVLNFGTNGYGLDQIYLQYMDEVRGLYPDSVIYLHSRNDLVDILVNDLFDLDENGELLRNPVRSSLFKDCIKNFYLTYALLGVYSSVSGRDSVDFFAEENLDDDMLPVFERRSKRKVYKNIENFFNSGMQNDDLDKALKIFSQMLVEMKRAADSDSCEFIFIHMPHRMESIERMKRLVEKLEILFYSLHEGFLKESSGRTDNAVSLNKDRVRKLIEGKLKSYFLKYRGITDFENDSDCISLMKKTDTMLAALPEHLTSAYYSVLLAVNDSELHDMIAYTTDDVLAQKALYTASLSREYFFKNDGHWNEEGNKIAAVYIFKYLSGRMGAGHIQDSFIKDALNEYYGSFHPALAGDSWISKRMVPAHIQASIKSRYLSLESNQKVTE